MKHYTKYAIDKTTGKTVSIHEVENGKACNCKCSGCGADLIARHGKIKVPHFAHAPGTDCRIGYQTSLHLLAKDILQESVSIILPPWRCTGHFYTPGGEAEIKSVVLEKAVKGIIPDVIVTTGKGVVLAIEIYVTHKVDDYKAQRARAMGLTMLEIDLSKTDREITKESLKEILLNGVDQKHWIVHPFDKHRETWAEAVRKHLTKRSLSQLNFLDGAVTCPIVGKWYPVDTKRRERRFVKRQMMSGKPYDPDYEKIGCYNCPFFSRKESDRIYCYGKTKIAELKDLNLTQQQRDEKYKHIVEKLWTDKQKYIEYFLIPEEMNLWNEKVYRKYKSSTNIQQISWRN